MNATKAKITLDYTPEKKDYCAEDVIAKIQFKSATFTIPCSELPDDFWETIVLSEKPFITTVDEEFVCACYNYTPEFFLRDVQGVWDCLEQLKQDSRLSEFAPERIENSFLRFWNSSQEPENVYYSSESAAEAADCMIEEFVNDSIRQNAPEYSARDKFDVEVAESLGMELRNAPTKWYFARWIDGGDGVGFNTFAQ